MGGAGEKGGGGTWLRVGESGGSLEKIRPLNLKRESSILGEEKTKMTGFMLDNAR